MCQAAELVRQALVGLVLERIGVHGVEVEPTRARVLVQRPKVVGAVPRDVERHRRRGPHEAKDRRAVVELVEDVARLARTGKSREPRPARADAPRRHGDAKRRRSCGQRVDVEAAASQHLPEVLVVLGQRRLVPAVLRRNQFRRNLKGCGQGGTSSQSPMDPWTHGPMALQTYLRNPSCNPPSTGMTWPVVLDSRSVTSNRRSLRPDPQARSRAASTTAWRRTPRACRARPPCCRTRL